MKYKTVTLYDPIFIIVCIAFLVTMHIAIFSADYEDSYVVKNAPPLEEYSLYPVGADLAKQGFEGRFIDSEYWRRTKVQARAFVLALIVFPDCEFDLRDGIWYIKTEMNGEWLSIACNAKGTILYVDCDIPDICL